MARSNRPICAPNPGVLQWHTSADAPDRSLPVSTRNELVRIGWRERVDLPTWGLAGVRAKIDTGARTSVIDVAQIETIDEGHVRFEVVWRLRPDRLTKWIEAEAVRTSRVKPSTGELQDAQDR